MMYSIKNNTQYVSCTHQDHRYMVTFTSAHQARKVHYMLPRDPSIIFEMYKNKPSIIIPKLSHTAPISPIMDMGYYLETLDSKQVAYQIWNARVGVMIAAEILEEDDDMLQYRVLKLDPKDNLPHLDYLEKLFKDGSYKNN